MKKFLPLLLVLGMLTALQTGCKDKGDIRDLIEQLKKEKDGKDDEKCDHKDRSCTHDKDDRDKGEDKDDDRDEDDRDDRGEDEDDKKRRRLGRRR